MPSKALQYLNFLKQHQPMPSDHDISSSEGDMFAALVEHFEKHPDKRCLPLLIGSVSKDTGLGMYEHISFVLMTHDKKDVVRSLRVGLRKGNDGIKYRCCLWASDVNAWELEELIRPLAKHKDEDISDAAEDFLSLKKEMAQVKRPAAARKKKSAK